MTKKNLRDEFFAHESKIPPNYEKVDSSPAELELERQRALDHLQSAIWVINDLIAAAPFPERPKFTQIVGQITVTIRQLDEIGGAP